jgi:hypothetical protein
VTTHLIALIDGEPGAFGVVFPDAPGCTAMGGTYEEALRSSVLSLSDWLAGGGPIAVRSVEELRSDDEVKEQLAEGSVFALVPIIR